MNYDDPFTPETIEEQIDQHAFSPSHTTLSPNARVIQGLQAHYEEDQHSVALMWERLTRQVSELESNAKPSVPLRKRQKKGTHHMQQLSSPTPEHPRARHALQRRLGLLVAVIIAVLLVGSLVTVLGLSHQKPPSTTVSGLSHQKTPSSTSTPTANPKSVPGQIVYSGKQENGWSDAPVWSADSQLLAASSDTQTTIWDATTGQHGITIPFIGQLAWSPTSNLLALASSSGIALVDGQTGQTVRTCSFVNASGTIAMTPSTGMTPLVSHLPLGSPSGLGGFAWSPDGKWIVSTYSYATSSSTNGVVQVWNTQTGDLAYTLATEPGFKMGGGVSWSPDGQYVAANMGKWNGQYSQVSVWNVQTRQVAFQQSVNSNQGFMSSSWQPGTDNFADALIVSGSDSSLPGTPVPSSLLLKIWNVKTGQLLKSYPGTFPGIDELSWSPDGQQAVYSVDNFAATASMIIMDINSGQRIYTYQVSDHAAQRVHLAGSWSPDGKYIASAENSYPQTLGKITHIVKVWTA